MFRSLAARAVAATGLVGAVGAAVLYRPQVAMADAAPNHGGITPAEFRPLKVKAIEQYNHNTKVYRFALDSEDADLNMPITSYVLAKAHIGDKDVVRPYTPYADKKGELTLLVKTYPNGTMSKHFDELRVGDSLELRGPMPKFNYEPNMFDSVTLIAGGTGITPVLQLAEAILKNPADKTKVQLVFANVSKEDIVLKEYLDGLAKNPQFKVNYIIDKPQAGWNGATGYLTADFLKNVIAGPADKNKVFVCGPPPMMKSVCGM